MPDLWGAFNGELDDEPTQVDIEYHRALAEEQAHLSYLQDLAENCDLLEDDWFFPEEFSVYMEAVSNTYDQCLKGKDIESDKGKKGKVCF